MFRLLTLLAAIAVLFTGTPARAADEPPLPEPLKKMRDDGAQMKYLGRDLGYDGWIAVENGQEQYFYVTPDGSAFFLGVLFNKNGRAVTLDQMKRLKGQSDPIFADLMNAPSQVTEAPKDQAVASAPATDKPANRNEKGAGEKLFADVAAATGFAIGKKDAPVVYSFIDPMCPHCKDLLRVLKPALDAGKVRVQVIPVGALAPESLPMAANLLAAKDAPDRLMKLAAGDTAAVSATPGAPTAAIEANLSLLTKWKFNATPISVYRGRDGSVKLLQGAPADAATLLKDLP